MDQQMTRAEFIAEFEAEMANHVAWCPTCGVFQETPEECPPCRQWWASNPPPYVVSLKYGFAFPEADLKPAIPYEPEDRPTVELWLD